MTSEPHRGQKMDFKSLCISMTFHDTILENALRQGLCMHSIQRRFWGVTAAVLQWFLWGCPLLWECTAAWTKPKTFRHFYQMVCIV